MDGQRNTHFLQVEFPSELPVNYRRDANPSRRIRAPSQLQSSDYAGAPKGIHLQQLVAEEEKRGCEKRLQNSFGNSCTHFAPDPNSGYGTHQQSAEQRKVYAPCPQMTQSRNAEQNQCVKDVGADNSSHWSVRI
jgi:hypothetical protein